MNVLTKNRAVLDVTRLEGRTPLVEIAVDDILDTADVRQLVTVPYALLERIVIHESSLTPTARATPVVEAQTPPPSATLLMPPSRPTPDLREAVRRPGASRAWRITAGVVAFFLTLTIVLSAFEARHRIWNGAKSVVHLVAKKR